MERTIGELNVGERTDVIVLAFRTAEGKFDTTPSSDDRLHGGYTLIQRIAVTLTHACQACRSS